MNERPSFRESETPVPAGCGVSVNIQRLVVEGVSMSAGQAAKLRVAVQHELTRLLQRDGLRGVLQGTAVPALAAPAISMSLPFHPAQAGRQIARCVYGSLTGRL